MWKAKTAFNSTAPAWRHAVWSLVAGLLVAQTALALPPAPANDDPANAEVITAGVPILGSSVLADDSISSTPDLPAINSYVDGPDVFFSFTPATTDTYRVHLWPWQHAPLRSSDRRFTVYLYEVGTTGFLAGNRAPGSARPVYVDTPLTAGVEYIIGVDHDNTTHDNFDFTLIVDTLAVANPDDCGTYADLPVTLPAAALNDIDGATADYTFTQGTGRCSVSGSTPTTAPGIDHVYHFVAPADGDYAVELISSGFDGVIYVMDSCPGVFPFSCLGASNHSTSGTSGGKHEFVVVTVESGKDYYIFVDNGSTTAMSGGYALIIDDAFEYEVNEVEPNDTPGTATPLATPLNGGQLVGATDSDYWAVTGLTGDRVYAYVNNGGSSNSTLDTELRMFAADGTTLVEFDDDDGDGHNSLIEDLRYIYSTSSSVIAGAKMTGDGTHYLLVNDTTATGTVHRYRFHVGVEPATRNPLSECEPNDDFGQADYTGKHYYAGVIDTSTDADFYAFEAQVGDRVFIACDGDPERDATGSDSANTDPNAFHAKLVVYDPALDELFSDISDSNTAQTEGGDYPAQGAFFVARTSGTHYVKVMPQSTSSQVGPTETYELAIFLDDAAPALIEDVDPLVTLVPDYPNNVIHGTATDNAPGDSGICSIDLMDNDNLQITNVVGLPGGSVTFDIELVNLSLSGTAKLVITDCAGNTLCQNVAVDVDAPICDGFNFSNRTRTSLHDPIHIPNNDLNGNTNGIIEIADPGLVTDVNVTLTIDTLDPGDMDVYLVSPSGTEVELFTDRASSLGIDITDATFDDEEGTEILPFLGSAAPYTGVWLPEDSAGLAKVDGEQAQGTWKLRVIDDSSSADFGATLVRWTLEVDATFPGPETFAGTATDTQGIQSIVLSGADNVQLNLPGSFVPGDTLVDYTVTLIDTTTNGSGTITITDVQANTCDRVINLNGVADLTDPANSGGVTTDLTYKQEVQQVVPENDFVGVTSVINVPESFLVGEVEVALMVDSDNQGRMAATLTHAGASAALVNRIGMDERGSSGNTKNSFDIILDDDAPQADDIHLEPALGTVETLGLHQPDGRGEFFGDGITTDKRDNMLFTLAGADASGDWELLVADTRAISSSDNIFRRWAVTLKNPCGAERYAGRAIDEGAGICSIDLAGGASNLAVVASFTAGDVAVDYRVELADPTVAGSGTLEISDCAGNVTSVPISLAPESGDNHLPDVSGSVNLAMAEFDGTAADDLAGDTGVATIELAPWSDNLQILATSSLPAATATFTVGLVDPMLNGRGYVRVTDGCGLRAYVLVELDAQAPVCMGTNGTFVRHFSGPLALAIPDNNAAGVSSDIIVTDTDIVSDVNLTLNITHGYDDDIDLTMVSPTTIALFSDIGSVGNDFRDTTLDDEAAAPIPDSSSAAPFTGSYQPEGGPALSALDGAPASGTYTLKVVDDKTNDTGTFDSWSLLVESATFPQSFDGRAEDSLTHDTGICSVDLLFGAQNLVLTVDPAFVTGDSIVRYFVELNNPDIDGEGIVRITDCAGNYCEEHINLASGGSCIIADIDFDSDVDYDDFLKFTGAFGTSSGEPEFNPAADMDGDGSVTLLDYQMWIKCYREFNGLSPTAMPAPSLAGDFDNSSVVDLADFVWQADCMSGAGASVGLQCIMTDMDVDGDVDLRDFATFTQNFGASQ